MPHSALDFRARAQLVELMDGPVSLKVLRSYLRGLARTNRLFFGHRPVMLWLESLQNVLKKMAQPIRILDVGCGYGDGLRRIEQWAASRGIAVELTGLDLNPDSAAIAADATPAVSRIQWVCADIFAYTPSKPLHLIVSSLFTHHLSNDEIIQYLKWMELHVELGWFINDLSRGAVSYHFFRAFSRLARLHPCVQHDGPISILRSFVPEDWREMCTAAGIGPEEVLIRNVKPGRLCVERRKHA
jgi:SAM-dependent methyltransferase